jgi:hypothetical protein
MKNVLFTFISALIIISCTKENTSSQSSRHRLLQNDWTYISSRIFSNGTNTWNLYVHKLSFDANGNAVKTTIVNVNVYNYYKYQLLPDDSTLLFFKVTNGIVNPTADTTTITTLNDSMLVFHSGNLSNLFVLDSLRR